MPGMTKAASFLKVIGRQLFKKLFLKLDILFIKKAYPPLIILDRQRPGNIDDLKKRNKRKCAQRE